MSKTILALGAHADDIELGCAGALCIHKNSEDRIVIAIVTNSNYKDSEHSRLSSQAKKEACLNSKKLDSTLEWLGFPTLELQANRRLINSIVELLEAYSPDIVYTHDPSDIHLDHAAVGLATLSACRHTKKILLYRSNLYADANGFNPNYFIDITEHFDTKIELIGNFKSEQNKLSKWTEQTRSIASYFGHIAACRYAEAFKIFKWIEGSNGQVMMWDAVGSAWACAMPVENVQVSAGFTQPHWTVGL